jgi:hypothetical protein
MAKKVKITRRTKDRPTKPTRKVGRPTVYKPEYNQQVIKLCLLGASDKEIADFFEVSESTLNNWKIEYPEFLESIKKGKVEADANVGSSLYNRAIGFTQKGCEKVFQYQGEIVRATVNEYFPTDTTAAIFWLKNRQPDKWRDKQEVNSNVNIKRTDGMTSEEIEVEIKRIQKIRNDK